MADEPWIQSDAGRATHAELRGRARRAAEGFRALGIREGDAVALVLANGFPFLEASAAATLCGAYPVPVDGRGTPEDIGFILHDCGARLIVTEPHRLAALQAVMPPGIPVLSGEAEAWRLWAEGHVAIASPSSMVRGAIIYTSGTTGRPKGICRAPAPPGRPPARALRVYGFDRPERAVVLIDGPLTHAVPNAYARMALGAGADIVLLPKPEPEATLDAVMHHRITHLHVVPAMMMRLLALPGEVKGRYDLSSLRHVVHGAAPCPPHARRAMAAWWGTVLFEYYGSTETGLLTFHGVEEAMAKPGSVGRALPGITLQVLDESGWPLPPGGVGTVYAGSESLHDFTYIGQADRRAAIGRGDLVTAGDLGWLDREGTLYLADRARDVVRVGEATVYPAMVEAVLSAAPGVVDCAVFGVPGADGADILAACVSGVAATDGALDGGRLRDALRARLPPEQVPARIVVMGALPRADSGKMMKHRLRHLWPSLAAKTQEG